MKVTFDSKKFHYDGKEKIIHVSEKDIPFATKYELYNPSTGKTMNFEFSHSTGAEFDPKTQWVYKSKAMVGNKVLQLIAHNDPQTTKRNADAYLKAKTGKMKKGGKTKYSNGGGVGKWKMNDVSNAKHLGIIEFQDNQGEWHNFEIMETKNRLIFGGFTNIGFIESGYIEKDEMSTDEALQELQADLEVYYNDGKEYTSMIVVNDRMEKGGGVGDKKWKVYFKLSSGGIRDGEVESVVVTASSKKEAKNKARESFNEDWRLIDVEEVMKNGGNANGFTYTIGGL